MRKLFCLFSLFAISLSASAASEWLYYKHYPWVYDNVSKDWLYLRGAADGSIYAYRSNTNKWEVFTANHDDVIPVPTWDEQYEEWVQNPEPYGGLDMLKKIKEAKDSGAEYFLSPGGKIINDLSPFSGLTEINSLTIQSHVNATLEPLASLTNLSYLGFRGSVPNLTPLKSLNGLKDLNIQGVSNIENLDPIASLTNLESLHMMDNNIADISVVANLQNLRSFTSLNNGITSLEPLRNLTNLEELALGDNEINDLSPLANKVGIYQLYLENNNVSDITPLYNLVNLQWLGLNGNSIPQSQQTTMRQILENTGRTIFTLEF